MIQETHQEVNYTKILPKGPFMIQHGPSLQPHQGAKGVA